MSSFGTALKTWRKLRRMSQLELATITEVSQRHLSFLETGRSRPSREMVIHLALALDVPLRQQNELLATAGYVGEYPETGLNEPALDQVRHVLELVLQSHEPFPAIVVDRGWDVVLANQAATRLTATLVNPMGSAISGGINALKLILHPDGVRRHVVNWGQVAGAALRRLEREIASRPTDEVLLSLHNEVMSYPGVAALGSTPAEAQPGDLLVPFHYRVGAHDLRLFSTIATLGEAHDVTLAELRLETFFAADAASETLLRSGVI